MVDDRHICPGGCGRLVAHAKFACVGCWYQLPIEIRHRINRAWRTGVLGRAEHAQAMAEARKWLAGRH